MAESIQDVQEVEITPDDFDGETQETPKAESSPAEAEEKSEAKEPEVATEESEEVETKSDDAEQETEEAPEEESKEDAPESDDETETKPQSKADERKAQLNTEIRDLVSQRNALKAEVEKINAEAYQVATEDELVDQGYSATDAKVEALRQAIEMKEYNDKVADAQLSISSEVQRVLDDFPIFNENSDEYDKELATEAFQLLQANLILDPNTQQVIGSNVSPYQLYKTLARASGISATKGQIKGQQDTEKMLANADAPASTAPAGKKPVDPLAELWSEEL